MSIIERHAKVTAKETKEPEALYMRSKGIGHQSTIVDRDSLIDDPGSSSSASVKSPPKKQARIHYRLSTQSLLSMLGILRDWLFLTSKTGKKSTLQWQCWLINHFPLCQINRFPRKIYLTEIIFYDQWINSVQAWIHVFNKWICVNCEIRNFR